MELKSIDVLEVNREAFLDQIAKLQKRAKKLGVALECNETSGKRIKEVEFYSYMSERTEKKLAMFRTFEISTDPIVIAGWEPVATITFEQRLPIFFEWPNQKVPEVFHDTDRQCDHCGHNRHRNQTYLICREGTDEYARVGSTCVRDFIGWDPNKIAKIGELYRDVGILFPVREEDPEGEHWGMPRGDNAVAIENLLGVTIAMIRKHGYLPKSKWTEEQELQGILPTSMLVKEYILEKSHKKKEWRLTFLDEDFDTAQKAMEEVRNAADDSTYMHNLKVLVEDGFIAWRNFGFAVSIIPYHERMKRQRESANKLNEHFGEVKKRYELTLKLLGRSHFTRRYGFQESICEIHRFEDADGRSFVWFASDFSSMEDGETYKVKGSVKKHDEYRGRKQTVLTRCKWLDENYVERVWNENHTKLVEKDAPIAKWR